MDNCIPNLKGVDLIIEEMKLRMLNTDSQYKGAYTVFFKEKIHLVMRNSNNRF
jgi:hypothetical protein